QTEADPPTLAIKFQHHRPHVLTGCERFPRMIEPLLPADIGDVNHSLDAISKVDESAEVREAADWAFDDGAGRILLLCFFPRGAERLLEAGRDTVFGRVDAENLCLHQLAGFDHVAGLAHFFGP